MSDAAGPAGEPATTPAGVSVEAPVGAPVEADRDQVGWLELFFDLVAVAAIAVLTDGLRAQPDVAGVGCSCCSSGPSG